MAPEAIVSLLSHPTENPAFTDELAEIVSDVIVGSVVSKVTEVLVIVDAALASESCASKANV
jgi:hypothetical protein